jgi:hypothetical protein
MAAVRWPEWWGWDLELSPHLLKRMTDRGFSEVELRSMMELAAEARPDEHPDRWLVITKHEGKHWEVIVEPDVADRILVVITAYPSDSP